MSADVKVTVKNTVQGAAEVAAFGKRLNSLLDVAQKSAVAVAAAGATVKKAFDLSREGANLNQLTSSFERMNAEVFKVPGLLDKMSEAARGTIKETDLMAGLLKLTAGASEDLAQRFAQAAPQLLEIAKASNKLNPALGDTAFLYDSIATGIKRASPLILDNLGIVVKVGEANEKYAAQLGKNVEALTAEEKQIALLNATMEAGGVLIEQVGGNVDSQADSWARLEVQVGTLTDRFKMFLAVGLGPTVAALAGDYGQAVDRAADKTTRQLETTEDLAAAMARANQSYELSRTALGRLTGTSDDVADAISGLAAKTAVSAKSYDEFTAVVVASGMDLATLRRILAETGDVTDDVNVSVEEAIRGYYELQQAINAAVSADENLLRLHRESRTAIEDTSEAIEELANKQDLHNVALDISTASQAAFILAQKRTKGAIDEVNTGLTEQEAALVAAYQSALTATDNIFEYSEVTRVSGGLTREQRDNLSELRDEYNRVQESIRSYTGGIKGLGLEEDKRNKALEELHARAAMIEAAMGGINAETAATATTTGQFVVSYDAMNQAIYDSAAASDISAANLAVLGGALGIVSEEAAMAALQTALIQESITSMVKAALNDTESAGVITRQEMLNIQMAARAMVDDVNAMMPMELSVDEGNSYEVIDGVGNALATIAATDWTATINVVAGAFPSFPGVGSEYDQYGNPVGGYNPPPASGGGGGGGGGSAPPPPPPGTPPGGAPGAGTYSAGGGMSGVTIIQNFYGPTDPAAVAARVAEVTAPRG